MAGCCPLHIRYAVVGLGHIAQVAVLPAFAHATAQLAPDRTGQRRSDKLRALSKKIPDRWHLSLRRADACLEQVDAVYIALPNSCTRRTPFVPPRRACTCCAKSRWRSPLTSVSG